MVIILGTIIIFDADICGCGTCYCSGFSCNHAHTGVNSSLCLHAGSHNRGFCGQKRHCLTLHVGSHQSTVGIIILKEWDQRRSHRKYHLRRNVHIIEHSSFVFLCLFAETTGYILSDEISVLIQRLISLCYMVIILFICSHIYNLVCDTRILRIGFINYTVWSLHEAILIDSCIRCKGVDQTNVRTFRCLNRAHSSVMRVVDISYLESGSVS